MPKINVATAFRLTQPDGSSKLFEVGEHTVDKDTAEHWFVKANLVGAKYEPKVGSYEYALRGRAQKNEEEAAAAERQAEADAQARADADARAADLMEKTNQTIAAVAQQAQDAATKDEPKPADAVTDLPPIPLASKSEGTEPVAAEGEATGEPTGEPKAE